MQKFFIQDFTIFLRMGFNLADSQHDPKFQQILVELIGIFFDMLEDFSKGKVIKSRVIREFPKK